MDPHLDMLAKWLDDGGPVLGAQSLILTDLEHGTLSRCKDCIEERRGKAEVPVLCGEHAAGQAGVLWVYRAYHLWTVNSSRSRREKCQG